MDVPVNEYFAHHPENILGIITKTQDQYGKDIHAHICACVSTKDSTGLNSRDSAGLNSLDTSFNELLQKAVNSLPENIINRSVDEWEEDINNDII